MKLLTAALAFTLVSGAAFAQGHWDTHQSIYGGQPTHYWRDTSNAGPVYKAPRTTVCTTYGNQTTCREQ